MEIEIDGVKYNIIPVAPSLSPYSSMIGDLLKKKPPSFDEAQQVSEEIAKAMDKLLSGTVEPTPRKEHHLQLFNAIMDLTNKVFKDAKFFRQEPESNVEEGNTARSKTAEETQRNTPP